MLNLTIPQIEGFDEEKNEFFTIPETKLLLEHSLISVSKWESKWKKPFLSQTVAKTNEEFIDYVKCMLLSEISDYRAIDLMPTSCIKTISEYIADPMTATTFSDIGKEKNKEIITNEIIYYWMSELHIPVEFQEWHLNRLITLIRVCTIKNTPEKELSEMEVMRRNRELNEQRKKQLHTRG